MQHLQLSPLLQQRYAEDREGYTGLSFQEEQLCFVKNACLHSHSLYGFWSVLFNLVTQRLVPSTVSVTQSRVNNADFLV